TRAETNDHSRTTHPFIPGASARCAPTRPDDRGTSSKRSLTGLGTRRCYLPRPIIHSQRASSGCSAGESPHPSDSFIGSALTQPTKTAHQQGVVLERLLGVDEATQQLVITRRTHAQLRADDLFLHSAMAR